MEYKPLTKLFYIDENQYKETFHERFSDKDTLHLDIEINGNKTFIVQTPELYKTIISIQRIDKKIRDICTNLPKMATMQFAKRCLIDEIVLTNNIEGVYSTRKEISDVLVDLEKKDKRKRFEGLVKKYVTLMKNEDISISSCKDIRGIYDDLFYDEVAEDDITNLPDGEIFRKDSVDVKSSTQKVIHTGVYPESRIINVMEQSLMFLNDNNYDILIRIAVFHYLFGYIHPFYDGNGRTSRFISSYLLSKELNHLIGYRISYTIKEHIKKYYDAFKICNSTINKGDLTPFVLMFVEVIEESMGQLQIALDTRLKKLNHYSDLVDEHIAIEEKKIEQLYFILIQASLFSENGISTKDLMTIFNIGRNTLTRWFDKLNDDLLIKNKQGIENYYSLDLNKLDKLFGDI